MKIVLTHRMVDIQTQDINYEDSVCTKMVDIWTQDIHYEDNSNKQMVYSNTKY